MNSNKYNRRQLLGRLGALAAMHAPLMTSCGSASAMLAPIAPVRFRRLTLQTVPLNAMKSFYGSTLGFDIIEANEDSFAFNAGDSVVEFRRSKQTNAEPFYHFAFSIAENKIQSAKEWTEKRTTVLAKALTGKQIIHFRNWNADAVYFMDPAGNIGEFIAHHSLPSATPGRFSLEDVLYTSEIGLVVEDVKEAAKELEPLLGIDQTPGYSNNFAAVGDARGFFIIVPEQRVWLPTKDVKAESYAVDAHLHSRKTATVKLSSGPFSLQIESAR